jgi:hypothetical protein
MNIKLNPQTLIALVLAVVMPVIGIMLMFSMMGGLKKDAIHREVRRAQNPSSLMLIINDTESRIRGLELELVKVRAIIDATKVTNVGGMFGDRNYKIDDVRKRQESIYVQLYGSFWDTIFPECLGWGNTEWLDYTLRWDDRKEAAKGVEWAREVENSAMFKQGYYPYQEGHYAKLARLNKELAELRSMAGDGGNQQKPAGSSIGNEHGRIDRSIPAP